MSSTSRRLTAAEAATRLGIQRASLYSYVSRGIIGRTVADDGMSSTFDAAEVEALTRRRRGRPPLGTVDVVLTTSITRISDEGVWYRGRPLAEIAGTWTFERTAEWLWTGDDPGPVHWPAASRPQGRRPTQPRHGSAAAEMLLTVASLERIGSPWRRVLSTGAFSEDQANDDLRAVGRQVAAALAAAAGPGAGSGPDSGRSSGGSHRPGQGSPSGRVDPPLPATGLADVPPGGVGARMAESLGVPHLSSTVDLILVLLADHELASSTLSARIAASTRADGYGVIGAGLGTLAGVLHGGVTRHSVELIEEVASTGDADAVIAGRLEAREHIPGFGHAVYRATDPRARLLFEHMRSVGLPPERLDPAEAVVKAAAGRLTVHPNLDLALAAFVHAAGLEADAAEWLFATARTAGWIAHAIEEYAERPVRFRPRSVYLPT